SLRSDINAEIESSIMNALGKEPDNRPPSATEWFESFERAVSDAADEEDGGESRLVIMAPSGSEVYVDDERFGSVGRSGRVILTSVPPGKHVLRVARTGEPDDERVIEIRSDVAEQIIEATAKRATSSHLTPSRGGSLDSKTGGQSTTLVVVMCTRCQSRFAEGVKFCGRCGNTTFQPVAQTGSLIPPTTQSPVSTKCGRCGQVYPPGTKFCGRCGIPIGTTPLEWRAPKPVEVICRSCGTSYAAGTRFCGRCGKPITS